MKHFWLRAETKPFERRRALSPKDVNSLIDAGHTVTVEESDQSIFTLEEYLPTGCKTAKTNAWMQAPQDSIILGLKELPDSNSPLNHTHIFFAHCFKKQDGWNDILARFESGNGKLYDLEFLTNENDRRVAAFGYWAGYAGAAVSWALWHELKKHNDLTNFKLPYDFNSVNHLHDHLIENFNKQSLETLVIGARGRSGRGASDFFQKIGSVTTGWDRTETNRGGPFSEILNFDIFINCVLMMSERPPFLNKESVALNNRLSIIGDVSCDATGPYNSLPIYSDSTTFDHPAVKVPESPTDLYVMAIDHLPSLLPKESSEDFSDQLLPHLLTMDSNVWTKALDLFNHHKSQI